MVVQNEVRAEIDASIDALFGPPKDTETTKDRLSLDRPNIRAVVSVELRISGVSQCLRRLRCESKRTDPS